MNHNHRPCRWYAQTPLGSFTSRAYRLIQFSFACVCCPTTADAVRCVLWPPLHKGRLSAAAGLGIAKAFWNHRHCRWFFYTIKKIRRGNSFCGSSCVITANFRLWRCSYCCAHAPITPSLRGHLGPCNDIRLFYRALTVRPPIWLLGLLRKKPRPDGRGLNASFVSEN